MVVISLANEEVIEFGERLNNFYDKKAYMLRKSNLFIFFHLTRSVKRV